MSRRCDNPALSETAAALSPPGASLPRLAPPPKETIDEAQPRLPGGPPVNLGMYLARGARSWPQRPAVLFRDRALSYRDLELRSNRLAHALRALGLQRGDRVAVVSPNRPEIVELECALYKAGLVKV